LTLVNVTSMYYVSYFGCSCVCFVLFFSVRLLSVLRGHSFFLIPATTANTLRLRRIFYPRFYPLHILILEKEPFSLFNVQC